MSCLQLIIIDDEEESDDDDGYEIGIKPK